jgi:sugar phosphate isomerase/epimerase
MSKPRLGAQLWTVRHACKTIGEVAETFQKVARIGYPGVQLSGFGPVPADEVAKAAREAGLEIVSSHTGWERFLKDLDGVIAEHKLWNCRHLAIGGLSKDYQSAEGLARFLAELGPVAERLAKEGMDFSYHNHSHELVRYGRQTWLEMLYAQGSPRQLKAELDTYWVQHGGGDPTGWILRCAGREPLCHFKDMCITAEREQRFAEIGEGNLNWPEILKACAQSGVEWVLVEQDNCYGRDPFESLAISYRNLKALGL